MGRTRGYVKLKHDISDFATRHAFLISLSLLGIVIAYVAFSEHNRRVEEKHLNETRNKVEIIERKIVKVSTCRVVPNSAACLEGIRLALQTCLADPKCHELFERGRSEPASAFKIHSVAPRTTEHAFGEQSPSTGGTGSVNHAHRGHEHVSSGKHHGAKTRNVPGRHKNTSNEPSSQTSPAQGPSSDTAEESRSPAEEHRAPEAEEAPRGRAEVEVFCETELLGLRPCVSVSAEG